ncbi:MAG: hypothetical protein P1P88_04930 [Bacteroidales bacterium]|nr:hypothetical protein [Bacteroidales bacterium]
MKIEIEINKEEIGGLIAVHIDGDMPVRTALNLLEHAKSEIYRKANNLLPKTGTVGGKEVYEVLDNYLIKDII